MKPSQKICDETSSTGGFSVRGDGALGTYEKSHAAGHSGHALLRAFDFVRDYGLGSRTRHIRTPKKKTLPCVTFVLPREIRIMDRCYATKLVHELNVKANSL